MSVWPPPPNRPPPAPSAKPVGIRWDWFSLWLSMLGTALFISVPVHPRMDSDPLFAWQAPLGQWWLVVLFGVAGLLVAGLATGIWQWRNTVALLSIALSAFTLYQLLYPLLFPVRGIGVRY